PEHYPKVLGERGLLDGFLTDIYGRRPTMRKGGFPGISAGLRTAAAALRSVPPGEGGPASSAERRALAIRLACAAGEEGLGVEGLVGRLESLAAPNPVLLAWLLVANQECGEPAARDATARRLEAALRPLERKLPSKRAGLFVDPPELDGYDEVLLGRREPAA